jgi:hypothetical protein
MTSKSSDEKARACAAMISDHLGLEGTSRRLIEYVDLRGRGELTVSRWLAIRCELVALLPMIPLLLLMRLGR